MIFQTEKQMKEFGDKVPADKKEPIETALTALKEAHKMQDTAAIDAALEKLNTAWTAASQDIYNAQSAGAAGQNGNPPTGEAPNENHGGQTGNATTDNVTDAEFEEVK
jgi:molecular chaperone DnaK